MTWYYGGLREAFGAELPRTRVAYAPLHVSKKFGPLWVVRIRDTEGFRIVAESYGGKGLSKLIRRGSQVPPDSSDLLEKRYKKWQKSRILAK